MGELFATNMKQPQEDVLFPLVGSWTKMGLFTRVYPKPVFFYVYQKDIIKHPPETMV